MPKKLDSIWIIRLGLMFAVVVIRLLLGSNWVSNLVLLVGWSMGYLLAEADHLLYVAVCNPHELSCQRVKNEIFRRNWQGALELLRTTKAERTRLPVHNIVTGFVVLALGIWVVTSSGSALAAGLVLGLGICLLTDLMADHNFSGWYWLFARDFSSSENKMIKISWGILIFIQIAFLIRG